MAAVIAKVRSLALGHGASPTIVESVYRTMIDAFIALELQQINEAAGGPSLTDDILAHASDELLSAADVLELTSRAGLSDAHARRDLAIGLISQLLIERLLVAGDLDDSGFVPWKTSTHDAIDRIRADWTAAESPFVSPGAVVWLDTTEAGQRAGEIVRRHEDD